MKYFRISMYLFVGLIGLACQTNHTKTGIYNVLEFGADPSGESLCTEAFQQAIDQVSKEGGGKLIVPSGNYLIGSIFLKDYVTIELLNGSTLIGSSNREDYVLIDRPIFKYNNYDPSQGKKTNDVLDLKRQHLININRVKHVALIGEGKIYGSGSAFWKESNPANDPQWVEAFPDRVSNLIEVQYAEDVKIKGITLEESPEWTIHLFASKEICIDDIHINNGHYGPNNDGIDITSCKDVRISNSLIKTCDDAICFKSQADAGSCERMTVTNCVIETHCVAIKTGNNLCHNDIRDIVVSNCVINHTSRPIGIYAEKGGKVSNIAITNIVANTAAPLVLNRPIHISVFNAVDTTSCIENVTISNFICETEGRILITSEKPGAIRNLKLRDIRLIYPFIEDPSEIAIDAKSSQISPRNPEARAAKAAIVVENVDNFQLDGLSIDWPVGTIDNRWKFEKRIENGSFRTHHYDYNVLKQCDLSVLWAKGLKGGYVQLDKTRASSEQVDRLKLSASSLQVIN